MNPNINAMTSVSGNIQNTLSVVQPKKTESNSLSIIPNKKLFVENIQKWVLAEKQLKFINEKTKIIRDVKHQLSTDICQYIQENNLSSTKIELSDGELKIYDKKEYPPLSFGYIEERLAEIVPDKSHVDFIIQHLKDNREIKSSPDIRRTYTKK
jgi:hypothetical protein